MEFDSACFLNQIILANAQQYEVVEYITSGEVGHMFRCRNNDLDEDRAIKFILKDKLKPGWENEIIKTIKLRQQENIIKYHTHNYCNINNEDYLYIMWDYIPNDTLKAMIAEKNISITLLYDIIITILHVFHACKETKVIHADLHSGNILIGKTESTNVDDTYRKIWITDFSRVTKESNIDYIDDYTGLINIIKDSLEAIEFHTLDGENKRLFSVMKNEFIRCLRETNIFIDGSARNPKALIEIFQSLINRSEIREENNSPEMSDYLAAEHLGDNFDEWKLLFVPKFIAINELLEKNISVLTGLRGCGKTMLFKRLSSYFNIKMGGPAELNGSDGFYGFYLNARDIAETFPWLPEDKEIDAKNQLIHNFNLRWSLEILIWIKELLNHSGYDLLFLNDFFKTYFTNYYFSSTDSNINYIIDIIKKELENSRLKSKYHSENWTLIQYDFLENFVILLKEKIAFIENKPFFFFLDDYSLPMVKSAIQYILNPIIFRRSANIIFKVSTESVESFLRVGLNKKSLEENDDYTLIDCGKLIFLKTDDECKEIIFEIVKRRIERHQLLQGRNLSLEKILGKTRFNDEKRAKIIRNELIDTKKEKESSKYLYQGWEVFYKMWSSDVREMINIFADMISLEEDLQKSNFTISDKVQDTVYKESGGQFFNLLGSATNPSEESLLIESEYTYGKHLTEIVEAFHQVASFDLKNKKSKNLNKNTIKKARRIEIANTEETLEQNVIDYYNGLIRYGIFIQDYRGKSVRGKVAPRLYLRSRLIPFFRLAFSKRDSITMSWNDLKLWLQNPKEYVKVYKKRKSIDDNNDRQQLLFNKEV